MRARLSQLLRRNAFAIGVVLAALTLRVVYNLAIHPPHDHVYSDMGGYFGRSTEMLDDFWGRGPLLTLFPPGTHWLLWLVRRVFGRDRKLPLDLTYALLGTLLVALTHAVARRFVADRPDGPAKTWIPRIVAITVTIHYLWIALGSYYLSEIPFACCLTLSVLFTLRLADGAPAREGFWLGLAIAIGAVFRPQILLSGVLIAALAIRPRVPKVSVRALAIAAIPIAVVLGLTSYRFYRHMGELGLVSSNGPMNRVFGRCHNTGLRARAPDLELYFGPTSLRGLKSYGDEGHLVFFPLDPTLGIEIEYTGHLWEKQTLEPIVERCQRVNGWKRTAKHTFTNVELLWLYNGMWPDASEKEPFARAYIGNATVVSLLFIPTILAVLAALARARGRQMLLALHMVALMITAALYFGDTRFRAPYDGIAIVLATDLYWWVFSFIGAALRATRGRNAQNPSREGPGLEAGFLAVEAGVLTPVAGEDGAAATAVVVPGEAAAVAATGGGGSTGEGGAEVGAAVATGAGTIETRAGAEDDAGEAPDSHGRK